MKKLLIITVLLCISLTGYSQRIQIDTTFNVEDLCLQQTLDQQSMLPYKITAGSILVTTFLVNEIIITSKFNKADPWEFVNAGPQILPIYITGVTLGAVVIVIGYHRTRR